MFKRWLACSKTQKATLRIVASLLLFFSLSIHAEAKTSEESELLVHSLNDTSNSQIIARRPLRNLRHRVENGLRRGNNPGVVIGTPNRLRQVLNRFRPRIFRVGSRQYSLGRSSMRHILTRHHPGYWDGSTRTRQTFFRRNMTINEIDNAIESVVGQNHQRLSRLGANGSDKVEGVVDGITYILQVNRGRIGSFYPKP
jgi:hypothetical protein